MRAGVCIRLLVVMLSSVLVVLPADGAQRRPQAGGGGRARSVDVEASIRARLARTGRGTPAFRAAVELLESIERSARDVGGREAQARFAFYRLQALKNAADSLDAETVKTAREWLTAHESEIYENEIAGRWMLSAAAIMRTHETFNDTAAADGIAWLYVQNGIGGECEGDVPCYVNWQNLLNGEYLRLHPRGRHATESVADIARALNGVMDNLEEFPLVLGEFNPTTRCGELHASLDALVNAVRGSIAPRQGDALDALDRFARLCQ